MKQRSLNPAGDICCLTWKPDFQVYFSTSLGPRTVDRLVNRIAHEAKGGLNVCLKNYKKQILKDHELIQLGEIDGAHWHFFQGARKDILDFLDSLGIRYTVY